MNRTLVVTISYFRLSFFHKKSFFPFLQHNIIATAAMNVDGKPAPTPNGNIADKKTIPPTNPDFNIHSLSHIDNAINPWHVAMAPTTSKVLSWNHPLIKSV